MCKHHYDLCTIKGNKYSANKDLNFGRLAQLKMCIRNVFLVILAKHVSFTFNNVC